MSDINYTTMAEALSDVLDPRNARGQSHEWRCLLLVIAAAMLSGEKTVKEIGQWVMSQGQELRAALKPPKQRVPSQATLRRALSIEKLEATLKGYQRALEGESGGTGRVVTMFVVGHCCFVALWLQYIFAFLSWRS